MTIRNGILSVEWRLAKRDTMRCKMNTESGLLAVTIGVVYFYNLKAVTDKAICRNRCVNL